jgi:muconate cycloisomerase
MTRAVRFEVHAVDLPFKRPFRHAAAERTTSSSVFVKCTTDTGAIGFGETLPREYVSHETRDEAFERLAKDLLPRLLDLRFASLAEVVAFLESCDGQAPTSWLSADHPHSAAWCAVDLALLDTFGRAFGTPVALGAERRPPPGFRYSPVLSADEPRKQIETLLKVRLFGFGAIKLKAGGEDDVALVRRARRWLGRGFDIRVDANMAWDVDTALERMPELARLGVSSFEQPLPADDLAGLARLVRETGLRVMADESLSTRTSLETLIARRAVNAVNVRVAKCGGAVAALRRCREALAAGLTVQVGCQVGESSLLSAANVLVIAGARDVTYGEGCFGRHLLREDPGQPLLQFRYGGRPPALGPEPGLGVRIDEAALARFTSRSETIG